MDELVVTVDGGRLRGWRKGSLGVFNGVPYAEPPVGPLRFRPPEPVREWDGVRDAGSAGPVAVQAPTVLETTRGMCDEMSEDCLTLNVWTPRPSNRATEPLPVMVWVHGGAFVNGSGSIPWYDGSALAARGDVVVVTINYRLGAFGFLDLSGIGGDAYDASGNAGLLDQLAALSWVKRNIAAFGGDPHRVCLVGESAGSMSIGTLLAATPAQGRFERAIMQSGCPMARPHSAAIETTAELLRELGVPTSSSGLDRLVGMPGPEIVAAADVIALRAQRAAAAGSTDAFTWSPVVDGRVLTRDPMAAIREGSSADVPVLIGTTSDEMRIMRVLAPDLPAIGDAELNARLEAEVGRHWEQLRSGYEKLHPGATADDLWWSVMSDRIFGLPTAAFIDARTRHGAPTWTYEFAWRSPAGDGWYGASHTMEIPFVFGTFGAPGVRAFLGDITPAMEGLSQHMQDAWVAFAHSGRADWPACDGELRPTMVFDHACQLADDRARPMRDLWAAAGG
jgi:para-nitrobenzyl esterase